MDTFREILLSIAAFGAAVVLITGLLMWAARRWIHRWAAVIIGVAVILFLGQQMVSGMKFCAADPVYEPPTAEAAAHGSEGAMRFNCDSLGGVIDYFTLYRVLPSMLLAISGLTLLLGRKPTAPK